MLARLESFCGLTTDDSAELFCAVSCWLLPSPRDVSGLRRFDAVSVSTGSLIACDESMSGLSVAVAGAAPAGTSITNSCDCGG